MADNVFDKLNEQSEILARIDKNTANESSIVEEMIRTNDPRMIEFVKTADRVFVYRGDKSELNRKNKKCRISCIKKMILALIQIATVLSAIYVPYMWCVLILDLLVYAYPIYKAVTFKPLPYEMKYDEMSKKNGIYDDNDILCGYYNKVWNTFLEVAVIIAPIFTGVSFWLIPFLAGVMHTYFFVLMGICAVCSWISASIDDEECVRYDLYFIRDNLKIPYTRIKEFMKQNNLK